jgi:hypothetical protein
MTRREEGDEGPAWENAKEQDLSILQIHGSPAELLMSIQQQVGSTPLSQSVRSLSTNEEKARARRNRDFRQVITQTPQFLCLLLMMTQRQEW